MLPDLPAGPCGLFLDVDGTLLDIAPRPESVVVPDSLLHSLALLDRELEGAVALVSGRAIADLDVLFSPLRFRASGVHGAEMRFEPEGSVRVSTRLLLPADLSLALRALSARYPGTLLEDKRYSVALHYRAAPDAGPRIREELEGLLQEPFAEDSRILPGHMVFEIKRPGFDKGVAVGGFLEAHPFAGRRPIFIGDDITDLPGLEKALACGGLAFSVTTLRPGFSGHFPSPESLRLWLGRYAEALKTKTGPAPH